MLERSLGRTKVFYYIINGNVNTKFAISAQCNGLKIVVIGF